MKSCKNCSYFGWKHPNSQLEDVCINCYYKQGGVPSNWKPMKKNQSGQDPGHER